MAASSRKPAPAASVLGGVVCFVHVATEDVDASGSIARKLSHLGATCTHLTKDVTHIIFKGDPGALRRIYDKAHALNPDCPALVLSPLWVQKSEDEKRRSLERPYIIPRPQESEFQYLQTPKPSAKRKRKSMQPKAAGAYDIDLSSPVFSSTQQLRALASPGLGPGDKAAHTPEDKPPASKRRKAASGAVSVASPAPKVPASPHDTGGGNARTRRVPAAASATAPSSTPALLGASLLSGLIPADLHMSSLAPVEENCGKGRRARGGAGKTAPAKASGSRQRNAGAGGASRTKAAPSPAVAPPPLPEPDAAWPTVIGTKERAGPGASARIADAAAPSAPVMGVTAAATPAVGAATPAMAATAAATPATSVALRGAITATLRAQLPDPLELFPLSPVTVYARRKSGSARSASGSRGEDGSWSLPRQSPSVAPPPPLFSSPSLGSGPPPSKWRAQAGYAAPVIDDAAGILSPVPSTVNVADSTTAASSKGGKWEQGRTPTGRRVRGSGQQHQQEPNASQPSSRDLANGGGPASRSSARRKPSGEPTAAGPGSSDAKQGMADKGDGNGPTDSKEGAATTAASAARGSRVRRRRSQADVVAEKVADPVGNDNDCTVKDAGKEHGSKGSARAPGKRKGTSPGAGVAAGAKDADAAVAAAAATVTPPDAAAEASPAPNKDPFALDSQEERALGMGVWPPVVTPASRTKRPPAASPAARRAGETARAATRRNTPTQQAACGMQGQQAAGGQKEAAAATPVGRPPKRARVSKGSPDNLEARAGETIELGSAQGRSADNVAGANAVGNGTEDGNAGNTVKECTPGKASEGADSGKALGEANALSTAAGDVDADAATTAGAASNLTKGDVDANASGDGGVGPALMAVASWAGTGRRGGKRGGARAGGGVRAGGGAGASASAGTAASPADAREETETMPLGAGEGLQGDQAAALRKDSGKVSSPLAAGDGVARSETRDVGGSDGQDAPVGNTVSAPADRTAIGEAWMAPMSAPLPARGSTPSKRAARAAGGKAKVAAVAMGEASPDGATVPVAGASDAAMGEEAVHHEDEIGRPGSGVSATKADEVMQAAAQAKVAEAAAGVPMVTPPAEPAGAVGLVAGNKDRDSSAGAGAKSVEQVGEGRGSQGEVGLVPEEQPASRGRGGRRGRPAAKPKAGSGRASMPDRAATAGAELDAIASSAATSGAAAIAAAAATVSALATASHAAAAAAASGSAPASIAAAARQDDSETIPSSDTEDEGDGPVAGAGKASAANPVITAAKQALAASSPLAAVRRQLGQPRGNKGSDTVAGDGDISKAGGDGSKADAGSSGASTRGDSVARDAKERLAPVTDAAVPAAPPVMNVAPGLTVAAARDGGGGALLSEHKPTPPLPATPTSEADAHAAMPTDGGAKVAPPSAPAKGDTEARTRDAQGGDPGLGGAAASRTARRGRGGPARGGQVPALGGRDDAGAASQVDARTSAAGPDLPCGKAAGGTAEDDKQESGLACVRDAGDAAAQVPATVLPQIGDGARASMANGDGGAGNNAASVERAREQQGGQQAQEGGGKGERDQAAAGQACDVPAAAAAASAVVSAAARAGASRSAKKAAISLTSCEENTLDVLRVALSTLGGYRLVTSDGTAAQEHVTHLVAGSGRRTIKLLFAVSRGAWVLKPEWVSRSLEKGSWVPEEEFEADYYPGIKLSRAANGVDGAKNGARRLLSSFRVAIADKGTQPARDVLKKLVENLGGKVVTTASAPECDVLITGGDRAKVAATHPGVHVVREQWLLSAIEAYQLPPFEPLAAH